MFVKLLYWKSQYIYHRTTITHNSNPYKLFILIVQFFSYTELLYSLSFSRTAAFLHNVTVSKNDVLEAR